MTSEAIRDPLTDHLLTPQNSAFVIIDYQPTQVNSIRSMDHDELVFNIVHTTKAALNYKLPIVLSTVNVSSGKSKPTIAPLLDLLGGVPVYDRTTINAWGRRRIQEGRGSHGPQKDHHDDAVDRGLSQFPGSGHVAGWLRGL